MHGAWTQNSLSRLAALSCLAAAWALPASAALGDDWPQWRGLNRDGVWHETGVVDKFSAKELPIKWRVPVSSGYSGPTVASGRVYVTDRVIEPKQIERVHCFDQASGKPVWSHSYDCAYVGVGYAAGPRASVTVDDGLAYSLGSMGHLFCFDAASGEVKWQHDCSTEYSIKIPQWGIAGSPLVEKNLVIVQIGGGKGACLAAFDKKNGKEIWKALDDRPSYSAPIVIVQAGQRVVACLTGDNVAALDPATGKVHWRQPFKPTQMVIGVATPVVAKNQLFVTAFYDGSMMLRLDPNNLAAELIWRRQGESELNTDALHSIIATPYFDGDHVYGVDSHGELRCLDAKTGDRLWENLTATPKARWSNIHMVKNGDRMWLFNERGELIIAKLSPQGYEEISRTKLIDPTTDQLSRRNGVCWAHPAFANKHVFVRNDKELVCASLAK